jgi:hypothetical protein
MTGFWLWLEWVPRRGGKSVSLKAKGAARGVWAVCEFFRDTFTAGSSSSMGSIVRIVLTLCGLWVFGPVCLGQEAKVGPSELLDRLAGNWILKGKIAGKETTHDVQARWILRDEYLELHEVSRERDGHGQPAYEAIVLVSWDPKEQQYACLWLDSTAGGALTSNVTCRAKPAGDSIPFVFTISASQSIQTAFIYDRKTDTWRWTIDNVEGGKTERFADVVLERVK